VFPFPQATNSVPTPQPTGPSRKPSRSRSSWSLVDPLRKSLLQFGSPNFPPHCPDGPVPNRSITRNLQPIRYISLTSLHSPKYSGHVLPIHNNTRLAKTNTIIPLNGLRGEDVNQYYYYHHPLARFNKLNKYPICALCKILSLYCVLLCNPTVTRCLRLRCILIGST
jgi:hypothetical protein